jgi:hypothetical protein
MLVANLRVLCVLAVKLKWPLRRKEHEKLKQIPADHLLRATGIPISAFFWNSVLIIPASA